MRSSSWKQQRCIAICLAAVFRLEDQAPPALQVLQVLQFVVPNPVLMLYSYHYVLLNPPHLRVEAAAERGLHGASVGRVLVHLMQRAHPALPVRVA